MSLRLGSGQADPHGLWFPPSEHDEYDGTGTPVAPYRITPLVLPGREPRFAQIEFAFQLAK
jgi:hypothetical protein